MIVVNSGQCFSMDLMSIVHAFAGSVPVSAEKGKRTCPVYDNGNKKKCNLSALQGSLESIKHLLVGRPDKDLVKGYE